MSTNFYVVAPGGTAPPWPVDGDDPGLHVGKSSAGWAFTFRGHDLGEGSLRTVVEWRAFLDGVAARGPCRLVTEYDDAVDVGDFWGLVDDARGERVTPGAPPEVWADDGCGFVGRPFC